ncbi:GtrA family protein [Sphingomonas sp. SM33]|uniref:GtrA family protein n=1 Tax=Sphingomonas telluris TaxID=2907998 RepID=A0ABS9VII0_9SPHN|nr:GtrA family protein [Sphingomonas telluris]
MNTDTLLGKRAGEFVRFAVVGCVSALLNTVIIVALTEFLRINYLISYALCFIGVTLVGFAANRSWSFKVDGQSERREVQRYYLVTTISTVIAMGISRAMVGFGVPYQIAVFLSAALVAPANFLTHRSFSFGLKFSD